MIILAAVPWRIDRQRKLRDIATLELADFADALFVDLIDTDDRVHRQVGSLYVLKFCLDLFFRRIDDQSRFFAENQFLDLDESKHLAMTDIAGIDLVDLPWLMNTTLNRFFLLMDYF